MGSEKRYNNSRTIKMKRFATITANANNSSTTVKNDNKEINVWKKMKGYIS